jgi:hypothetical protein
MIIIEFGMGLDPEPSIKKPLVIAKVPLTLLLLAVGPEFSLQTTNKNKSTGENRRIVLNLFIRPHLI